MYRVARAIAENDGGWLRGWLWATFEVEPSPTQISNWLMTAQQMMTERARKVGFSSVSGAWIKRRGVGWGIYVLGDRQFLIGKYADDDWRMWFGNRLEEAGLWPTPAGASPPVGSFHCEMHTGFMYLEETPEMLDRLRQAPAERVRCGPTSPGIERTAVVLEPIDRVAARVIGKGSEP